MNKVPRVKDPNDALSSPYLHSSTATASSSLVGRAMTAANSRVDVVHRLLAVLKGHKSEDVRMGPVRAINGCQCTRPALCGSHSCV